GRFSLTSSPQELAKLFGISQIDDFPPRYNIAPTQPILMLNVGPTNELVAPLVRWGLMPPWVKDPADFTLLVNARSETATQKPSFKNAMRHKRSLIPASGFYEWFRPENAKQGEKKQAYWIRPKNGGIVCFGGLMETWAGADGSEIDTGCILTTNANKTISPIHHRMPVIIEPKDFERWLDCKTQEPRDILDLMQPAREDLFEAIAVSDLVNKVSNATPKTQEPISEEERLALLKNNAKQENTKKSSQDDQFDLF
ncbi:MAG: SOS response-associated peptidase, partial [Nitratireductor sp.]